MPTKYDKMSCRAKDVAAHGMLLLATVTAAATTTATAAAVETAGSLQSIIRHGGWGGMEAARE